MGSTPIDDQCILLRDICYTARRISFLALACDSVLGCSGGSLFATLTRAPLAQLTRADKLLYRQRSNPARMNKEALVPHPLSLCALNFWDSMSSLGTTGAPRISSSSCPYILVHMRAKTRQHESDNNNKIRSVFNHTPNWNPWTTCCNSTGHSEIIYNPLGAFYVFLYSTSNPRSPGFPLGEEVKGWG